MKSISYNGSYSTENPLLVKEISEFETLSEIHITFTDKEQRDLFILRFPKSFKTHKTTIIGDKIVKYGLLVSCNYNKKIIGSKNESGLKKLERFNSEIKKYFNGL